MSNPTSEASRASDLDDDQGSNLRRICLTRLFAMLTRFDRKSATDASRKKARIWVDLEKIDCAHPFDSGNHNKLWSSTVGFSRSDARRVNAWCDSHALLQQVTADLPRPS